MVCDRICDLPDFLLTQILLNLQTKDSVKTSVLSTRWRNLWLSVPGLDIITNQFPSEGVYASVPGLDLANQFPSKHAYASFIDRFLEFNQESCLHVIRHRDSFRYQKTRNSYNIDRLIELISTVVDRGIQHLDISILTCNKYAFMSPNIYKTKTLVSLKLAHIGLKNPEFVVSLPCLKILHLRSVCHNYDAPLILEKLISGCPLLEDLKLFTTFGNLNEKVVPFLRVRSQTLKRCCLGLWGVISRDRTVLEIDAPRLEYLSLSEPQPDGIVVKNLSSLLMISFGFNYQGHFRAEDLKKRQIFCDFLTGISSVRHMVISQWTTEMLYRYSKLASTPQFHNLYHLQAYFSTSSLQLFLAFLESCPNLKKLNLGFCYSKKKPRQIDFTHMPRCLISTLEYVEIKKRMTKGETEIIKLVNYFLENSAVLKKLTLSFTHPSITKQELESYKKLLTSTKLSPTCHVVIESLAADDCFVEDYYCKI